MTSGTASDSSTNPELSAGFTVIAAVCDAVGNDSAPASGTATVKETVKTDSFYHYLVPNALYNLELPDIQSGLGTLFPIDLSRQLRQYDLSRGAYHRFIEVTAIGVPRFVSNDDMQMAVEIFFFAKFAIIL